MIGAQAPDTSALRRQARGAVLIRRLPFIKLRIWVGDTQTLNIRTRLWALTFATLLPMAIFGAVGAYMLVQKERDSFERAALDRVGALMTAIDAEMRASITPLEMLARSPLLDGDDLIAFRAEAERALEGRRDDWSNIVVSHPDTAQMLLNLLVPPGAPLFKTLDPASVLESAKSQLGHRTPRSTRRWRNTRDHEGDAAPRSYHRG